MAHRLIVNLVITGSQAFGRAFSEAYKQASTASASAAAANATKQKTGGLTLEEACKILDVESSKLTLDKAQNNYEHLFNVNSKEKSGSFYLQSKVYRALERIKLDLEPAAKSGPAAGEGASGTSAAPGGPGGK
ncbi:protein transporter [Nadsonia fulvescens var. elongata DSM 6958]|uniref:Mitochondrial import inner membrane translocase subunit TIM16 n=1 Tax=Nadsonia fulvescens var. elongata DSM 6958 TaxID=857566 RepID=A0A1E3PG07_9ASCO|nr:protein transporter [Nadsonia fulvescens var. elongata DSM 6958]